MLQHELVIRTKLTPPRPRRRTLYRPRLVIRLSGALEHRLTILHAGTGYGKSTALASLADQGIPVCWYSVADEDTDPLVFLLHLIYACKLTLPDMSDAPLAALGGPNDQQGPAVWNGVVDALINALTVAIDCPTLLVLDDYHLVGDAPQIAACVDRLTGYAPANLHIILSSRRPPEMPGLVVWRARGELLEINH